MLPGHPPPRRKVPMTLDAVRSTNYNAPRDLLRIDHIRSDGVAVCSRINDDGTLMFVLLQDGRRFALRGVQHWPVSQLRIVDDIPLVKYPECEFCGDPATRIETFDEDIYVCDACSA